MKLDLNENIPGANNFRWFEALWLAQWDIYVYPSREEAEYIAEVAQKLEKVRKICGDNPIRVHSWLRPNRYNSIVGGATHSMHCKGGACDFTVHFMNPDHTREILLPKLDELKIRMENLPGASWVHIDLRTPGGQGRFFKP